MKPPIIIAADHGGVVLKTTIIENLTKKGYQVIDCGTESSQSVDFPEYAQRVVKGLRETPNSLGILVCGTGIGMSIAANKFKGIRAAVVSDVFSAKATREHNDSNILCLGARVIGEGLALMIVEQWLTSSYLGGKYQARIDQVIAIEER